MKAARLKWFLPFAGTLLLATCSTNDAQPVLLHSISTGQQRAIPARHLFLVAIDAGHGGKDPGTHSRNGVLEKNVTLALAYKLAADLNAQPGLRAILIRKGDYFIPLNTRAAMARQSGASLFVSLHANASPDHHMHGFVIYTLSKKRWPQLASPWRVSHDTELADSVTAQLKKIEAADPPPIKHAIYRMLRKSDVPTLLVEVGFLSNPAEAHRLADSGYQSQIAQAIAIGIRQYAGQVRGGIF